MRAPFSSTQTFGFTHRPFSGWSALPFDVEPRFDCYERCAGGEHVALFGYRNPRGTTVAVPAGPNNQFSPGAQNRLQPTDFLPGTKSKLFAVQWQTQAPLWQLNGMQAVVDTRKLCPRTTAFSAIEDTTVRTSEPQANFGTALELQSSGDERALVQFDRAALIAELGPNRLIRSARLEFTLTSPLTGGVEAVAMRRGWTELGATWNCANDSDASVLGEGCTTMNRWTMTRRQSVWDNPWREYAEGRPANVGVVAGSTLSFDVTADTQRFLGVEGVRSRPGWALLPVVGSSALARLAARESGGLLAPRLIIEPIAFTDVDAARNGDVQAPLSFVVDPSVAPVNPPMRSMIPGGASRPLAAVLGPDGSVSEFAERELTVYTETASELSAIQSRLGATLVYQEPRAFPGLTRLGVLQIDPTRANPAVLAPVLLSRVPGLRGRQRVSSDAALRLLAAAADESSRGTAIGLNFAAKGVDISFNSIVGRTIIDGPSTTIPPFTSNVGQWPHFSALRRKQGKA